MTHSTSPLVWLFDLDDTLHHTSLHLFPRIDAAMTDYIARHLNVSRDEADFLRRHYWQRYGATMLGLMRHHGTDPHDFLARTHDFPDLAEQVVFCQAGRATVRALGGRKAVVSNGPHAYVQAVLSQIKMTSCFEAVFGIEQLGLIPKPAPAAFRRVLHALRVPAGRCVLVDDNLPNLRTARALGMRTVWISRRRGWPDYVDLKLARIAELRRHAGRLHRAPTSDQGTRTR